MPSHSPPKSSFSKSSSLYFFYFYIRFTQIFTFPLSPSPPQFLPPHWDLNIRLNSRNGIFFKQYCLPHGEKVESLVYLSVPYISQSPETSHHMCSPYVTTQKNSHPRSPPSPPKFQKPTFHSQHSTPTNPPLNTLFSFHYPADNKRSISKTATNSTPHNP